MRYLPPSLTALAACLLLCAGCASNTAAPGSETPATDSARESKEAVKSTPVAPLPAERAVQELTAGIASYEDGAYKQAARQLQNALSLGLEKGADQARAHKYLAFMHCVGKRPTQCRDEFRKAFEADAGFDLSTAEAGHPTWGPVFRKVKAERAAAKKGK